jgi:hypothetical protein
MKRTLILLLLFLLLGGGVVWYLSQDQTAPSTLTGTDRDFATDIEEVHKIFIADRLGERTTLEKRDGYWLYNGKYEARPSVIRPLVEAIQNVRIQYKPPRAAVENMVNVLATQGIKVELYDKEDALIKTYYVGGSTSDERGTYMIMEGADQPYVVEIPAWEGNLSVRFRRTGDEWRKKLLFEHQVEEIKSVSVEYPKQRQNSFILEQTSDGVFDVQPFYDITPRINRPMRAGSGEAYLVNFEKLSAEAFRNDIPEKDSIRQQIPFSIITLTDRDDKVRQVKLYPIIRRSTISQDLKSGEYIINSGDIERYHVDVDDGTDFMLAQNRLMRQILWGYRSFFDEKALLD